MDKTPQEPTGVDAAAERIAPFQPDAPLPPAAIPPRSVFQPPTQASAGPPQPQQVPVIPVAQPTPGQPQTPQGPQPQPPMSAQPPMPQSPPQVPQVQQSQVPPPQPQAPLPQPQAQPAPTATPQGPQLQVPMSAQPPMPQSPPQPHAPPTQQAQPAPVPQPQSPMHLAPQQNPPHGQQTQQHQPPQPPVQPGPAVAPQAPQSQPAAQAVPAVQNPESVNPDEWLNTENSAAAATVEPVRAVGPSITPQKPSRKKFSLRKKSTQQTPEDAPQSEPVAQSDPDSQPHRQMGSGTEGHLFEDLEGGQRLDAGGLPAPRNALDDVPDGAHDDFQEPPEGLPTNHMKFAAWSLVLGGWLFGLPAILAAAKVHPLHLTGEWASAQDAAKRAKTYAFLSFLISFLVIVLAAVLFAMPKLLSIMGA